MTFSSLLFIIAVKGGLAAGTLSLKRLVTGTEVLQQHGGQAPENQKVKQTHLSKCKKF